MANPARHSNTCATLLYKFYREKPGPAFPAAELPQGEPCGGEGGQQAPGGGRHPGPGAGHGPQAAGSRRGHRRTQTLSQGERAHANMHGNTC